ncbi:MAG: hypothetical protein LBG13_01200 [Holosporales bacterium]|jgi:hypothetical protein|nr:hypothetical protein [Holosporales bacterium]
MFIGDIIMTKISDLNQKITLMKYNEESEFSEKTLSRPKFVPVVTARASLSLLPRINSQTEKCNEFQITFKNMNFNNHISAIEWANKILLIKKYIGRDEKYVNVIARE